MLVRLCVMLAGLAIVVGGAGAFAADPPAEESERAAMPAEEELASATKTVREVFAAKLKAASSAPKRQELAKEFIDKAIETADDRPGQCALFREARTLAVAAGDVKLALRALEEMARFFQYDELTVKAKTLLALGESGNKANSSKELAAASSELFGVAIRADNLELAKPLGQQTATVALKAKEPQLAQRASKRMKELDALVAEFAKKQGAAVTLVKTPDDPEANLVVGKYICFINGDWETGLRHLAKGSDDNLKLLANQEFGEPTDPGDQVTLGDGWWTLGEGESAFAKPNLMARAVHWYGQALPGLTGLAKSKTEKRLDEAAQYTADLPPKAKGWIRLLPLVDLKRDSVQGKWERDRDAFSTKSSQALLQLPYQPPEEYDLRYSFTRLKGRGGVGGLVMVAKKQLTFGLGWWDDNSTGGFENFNNRPLKQGPFAVPFQIENGKKYDVLLQVRKGGVQAIVNGKPLVECKTNGSDITPSRGWKFAGPNLCLFTKDDAVFHSAEVRDVTGKGKLVK